MDPTHPHLTTVHLHAIPTLITRPYNLATTLHNDMCNKYGSLFIYDAKSEVYVSTNMKVGYCK